jgi:hypothetical protein
MEDQAQSVQPPINSPILEVAEKKSGKKGFIIGLVALLVLALVVTFGLQFFGGSNKKAEIVVNQKVTPSLSPANAVNNTSDAQIDQDAQAVSQIVDNLENDLSDIDKSLNEEQVNLQ